MKKLYTILNAAFWCFIGVFLGVSLYTCWDYHAPPRTVCAAIRAVVSEHTDTCAVYRGGVRDAGTGNMDFAEENVIMQAGHARPYRHNKKHRTGTFLHWYGVFYALSNFTCRA